MTRTTLVTLHVLGWIWFAMFLLFGFLTFAAWLSGSLEEGGHRSGWSQVTALAVKVAAFGLPGLALAFFMRRRLREASRDRTKRRGFDPLPPRNR